MRVEEGMEIGVYDRSTEENDFKMRICDQLFQMY